MIDEKVKYTPLQDRFIQDCEVFLSGVLKNDEKSADPELSQDIRQYVSLLGLDRLAGKVNNEEVVTSLKEVITQEQTVNLIKNWMHNYSLEEDRRRAEEESKAKQNIEPPKKARVPEIYATAKPEDPKKPKASDKPQERPKKEAEKDTKEKAKEPRQVGGKAKLSERIQDQQPAGRKRVKPDVPHPENEPMAEQGIQIEQDKRGEQQQQQPQTDGKSKCKYFPFCKKENCPYFHPTEKVGHSPLEETQKNKPDEGRTINQFNRSPK